MLRIKIFIQRIRQHVFNEANDFGGEGFRYQKMCLAFHQMRELNLITRSVPPEIFRQKPLEPFQREVGGDNWAIAILSGPVSAEKKK